MNINCIWWKIYSCINLYRLTEAIARYIRQREPDGKSRTKGFSILRLGLHPAFEAAVKYRKELNETMKRVKPGVTEGD